MHMAGHRGRVRRRFMETRPAKTNQLASADVPLHACMLRLVLVGRTLAEEEMYAWLLITVS